MTTDGTRKERVKAAAAALFHQVHDAIFSRTGKRVIAGVAAAVTAYSAFSNVGPHQFAIRETLSVVNPKIKSSGIYFQIPFIQYTHRYNAQTQRFEFGAAGSSRFPTIPFLPLRSDTSDQNLLTADVALNYQVLADSSKLSYHLWSMKSWFSFPDGYFVITQMLNDSTNAVLGRRSMAETLADPSEFTRELYKDFLLRLDQNNVPIKVLSLEIRKLNTTIVPTKTVAYRIIGPNAAGAMTPH